MARIYLDTSALAKRYVQESGTDVIDSVFDIASPQNQIVLSFWNLGECLVVFDKYRNRGHLADAEVQHAVQKLLAEVHRLFVQKTAIIVPVSVQILSDSWRYILEHHIFEADALQLATFKLEKCDFMLTADKRLVAICSAEQIEAYDVEEEKHVQELKERIKKL